MSIEVEQPASIKITMSNMSSSIEEGTLAKWLIKEGDMVSVGDVIAEVETDKATMEMETAEEGTVAKILVPEGSEGVKADTVIALLIDKDVTGKEVLTETGNDAAKSELETDTNVECPDDVSADPAQKEGREIVFTSPLARRLAEAEGIEINNVEGTGSRGKVVKADVESVIAEGKSTLNLPSSILKAPNFTSDDPILRLFETGSYELAKHDSMRKTIAQRLVAAKSTIPHFYLNMDCQLDALLALRKQINEAAPTVDDKPAYRVSVNDMLIKAMALALKAVPDANVSWTESATVKHKNADVGVAVTIPGGLITPIVRRADEKALPAISNEMKNLAELARNNKLKPEQYQGGTTVISNLGMYGIKQFSAIINPPHATILAVGAGKQQAVVKNGEVAIATVMPITLSADHRCVDGALGAELLSSLKSLIENPMSILV